MELAHGFMTLIADEGQRLSVLVVPPRDGVKWVIHLGAYPCDLSIQLDRQGLELLVDRIGQALQDHGLGGLGGLSETREVDDDNCDRLPSFMRGPHDPHKPSPGADDEGVDLDDPAFLGRPEQE